VATSSRVALPAPLATAPTAGEQADPRSCSGVGAGVYGEAALALGLDEREEHRASAWRCPLPQANGGVSGGPRGGATVSEGSRQGTAGSIAHVRVA
jgi:hypothetical protein